MDALRRILLLSLTALLLLACRGGGNATPSPGAEGVGTPSLTTASVGASPTATSLVPTRSVEAPRDDGGFWFTGKPVPGGDTWLSVYNPLESVTQYDNFQSRLALFDPETGSLKEVSTAVDVDCIPKIDTDGRFIVWMESQCGSDTFAGWKMYALDLQTGERWEVARDSGVAFYPGRRDPSFSVQGGRLAYSLFTANASGQPVYEMRVVDLESRSSTTVLGPFDANEASVDETGLDGNTLLWTWNIWQDDEVIVRGLWKMELPDGKPEVLAVGGIGGYPTISGNRVVYSIAPDLNQPEKLEVYLLDLNTGDKRKIADSYGDWRVNLAGKFAYWIDQKVPTGFALNLDTGKKTSVGTPYVGRIQVSDDRVTWVWRQQLAGGGYANQIFVEWADLP